MLTAKDVDLKVGSFRLTVDDFNVRKGEFHVLLGPTASGKTTFFEFIVGLLPAQKGMITLNDTPIFKLPPEKRGISYVSQDIALFPHMTANENVYFGCRFNDSCDKQYIEELIEATGIKGLLDRLPHNLSGGEKQRVALVRGLANKPALLLLDEPLSALHPSLKVDLQRLLKKLHQRFELTVLMVSHDIEESLYLGDVISLIIDGSIQQTSKKKEIYYFPKTRGVAEFFGIKNIFKGHVQSIDDNWIYIDSPMISPLRVKRTFRNEDVKKGQDIFWGIHAEEVTVVKPERKNIDRKNVISASIDDIHEYGRDCLILLTLEYSGTQLEITVPDFTMRKLNLAVGNRIEIELNENKIFVIREIGIKSRFLKKF